MFFVPSISLVDLAQSLAIYIEELSGSGLFGSERAIDPELKDGRGRFGAPIIAFGSP
jgi:hypothetical protein